MRRLFVSVGLATLAVCSTFSTNSVAQQQYRRGDCFYQAGSNQLVGCYFRSDRGRIMYKDSRTGYFLDVETNAWFGYGQNNVAYIWTRQGWQYALSHPTGAIVLGAPVVIGGRNQGGYTGTW